MTHPCDYREFLALLEAALNDAHDAARWQVLAGWCEDYGFDGLAARFEMIKKDREMYVDYTLGVVELFDWLDSDEIEKLMDDTAEAETLYDSIFILNDTEKTIRFLRSKPAEFWADEFPALA